MADLKEALKSDILDLKFILNNVNKYSKRPKLFQSMLKTVCKVWSEDTDDRMILALLIIVKALRRNEDFFSACTRSMYLTYVKNSKFIYGNRIANNNLMKNGLLEVYSLQLDEAYKHAFVFIRQLAITVRKACHHTNKEEIRSVYNWQFVCSLKFWSEFVARNTPYSELIKSLIHPLTMIILGAVNLSPGSRWIPLRFHLVECLHQLAGVEKKLRSLEKPEGGETKASTASTLVPSVPLLLRVFQLFDFNKRASAASKAPMDLRLMLHFSPSQRKETACMDAVAAWLHDLLTEALSLQANSVAFPEFATPAITEIRKFLNSCRVANFTRNFKSLLTKVTEHCEYIKRKRACIRSILDLAEITALESTLGQLDSPLMSYYLAHRKIRIHELSVLTERFKNEGEEHMHTEDAFADDMDAVHKSKDGEESRASKATEKSRKRKAAKDDDDDDDDSDESDADSDASYDIDDGTTVTHVSRKKPEDSKDDDDFDLEAALNEADEEEEDKNAKEGGEAEDELKDFRIDDFDDDDEEEIDDDEGTSGKRSKKKKNGMSARQRILQEDPDLGNLDAEESEVDDDDDDDDDGGGGVEGMDVDMDSFSSGEEEDEEMEVAPKPSKVKRLDEPPKKAKKKKKQKPQQQQQPQQQQSSEKGKKKRRKNKNKKQKGGMQNGKQGKKTKQARK